MEQSDALNPNSENPDNEESTRSVRDDGYPDHKRPSSRARENILNYSRAVSIRKTSDGSIVKNLLN